MFTYSTSIRLRDTDATGVLFFTEQFRIASEAFEEYLEQSGFTLGKLIHESDYLIPIVHVEGDYFGPLLVGDPIIVLLEVSKIGNSSFTLHYQLIKEEEKVGEASIVHVCVSKEMKASHPIPDDLLSLLRKIHPRS
jgi:YbgC/YbaW family acyl-CoA thioester hydrolase